MSLRRATLLAGVLALFATLMCAQGALDRSRRALESADLASARIALLELFDQAGSDRIALVTQSVDVFRKAGASDTWVEAAERWAKAHPADPLIDFYRGVVWQDLKHLKRADEALSHARTLAPDNPAVTESWARNADHRFDRPSALERSRGATFPGVEAFRAYQEERLSPEPVGMVVLFALLGAALLGATCWALVRLGAKAG